MYTITILPIGRTAGVLTVKNLSIRSHSSLWCSLLCLDRLCVVNASRLDSRFCRVRAAPTCPPAVVDHL